MINQDDNHEGGSAPSGIEPTRVDLGDDLIEKTAIIPGLPSSSESGQAASGSRESAAAEPAFNVEDQLQSARILLTEGFPEEAKKVLRQVLLAEPGNRESRKLLDEIHDAELKQMFGSAEPVVRKSLLGSHSDSYDESILSSDSEEIIRLLDRDMHLNLGAEKSGLRGAASELSFFSDSELLNDFGAKLDRELGDAPRDRVDLAIGFLEMGLYPVSVRLLQPLTASENERERLNAVALSAFARILADESYEAISALQPVLNDNDVEKAAKTEIFYLMGRALQALSQHAEAIGWFLQALENEAGYRDCADRIARSKAALSQVR